MQKLYSASQSKDLDTVSQERFSIPGSTLMEDASFSTYLLIKEQIATSSCVLFIAGGGNNGGDALAIARLAYLDGNRNTKIMLADNGKETDLRKAQRQACEKLEIDFTDTLESADLIIDGLFGIGLKGAPRAPFDKLIEDINRTNAKVIALDVPSGIGDDVPFGLGVKAHTTVCMGVLKSALYNPKNRDYAGTILKTFDFFPSQAKPKPCAKLLEKTDLVPNRLKGSDYKKTRGSVAILGGSGRFTGAVVLAAKAAFHAGAGLVTIYTEQSLIPSISKAIPSAMVTTYESIKDLSEFDAVLVGPGMGKDHDDVLRAAMEQARRLVIDADGIRAMARLVIKADKDCILTPHLGEYAALVDAFAKDSIQNTPQTWEQTLSNVQQNVGATVVVKANTVYVKENEDMFIIDGQNPSLGVAGSGDVLAGITLALLAKGRCDAAKDAALLHQMAGKKASEELGLYSSDELIRFIGKV